jgi:XTP/dITP diphosphohydrolase
MLETPRLELLVATRNSGKVQEIKLALQDLPLRLRFPEEFPELSPVEESGKSYEENAVIKARSYAKETGLCALADDSGLEVAALGGGPGMLSARYAGSEASDEERIGLVLSQLLRSHGRERQARFICVVAIANPQLINVARGSCEGRIAYAPRGKNGFGFDPIFIPEHYESTFAELSLHIKNKISHRAQALARTRHFLSHWLPDFPDSVNSSAQ